MGMTDGVGNTGNVDSLEIGADFTTTVSGIITVRAERGKEESCPSYL